MTEATCTTRHEFVRAQTRLLRPALCPEIRLHAADEFTALWQTQQHTLQRLGIDTPYWSVPWAGGQALARFILDQPTWVRKRRVLDVGCGGGICALAACLAGAEQVWANDPDPLALSACALNATHNDAELGLLPGDLLQDTSRREVDVVLAADLWFESCLAQRVTAWLRGQAEHGVTVLIGDPYRAYLPQRGLEQLAQFMVPTSTEIERHPRTRAGVWRLLPQAQRD